MDPATYLAHLRREFGAFEACLAGDLSAPVRHCGGWRLYDLADHLGQGNMWAAVAADGIAEVVETMAPRQVRLGRATAPRHAVRLRAGETGSSWALGPGEPVATIGGTAANLLLLLWGRLSADDPSITWDGDRRFAQATLGGALVP
ncbi:MAG: maleylpyruvate isomerase N-terminal domain-containing protein [Streptosporangiaceae bacterium]